MTIFTRTTEILHCIDRGDDRIFLGVHAGEEMYATKGQKTVALPSGEVRTVSEIRDWMKHDIQNEVRPPSEVAAILRTLHGIDVTADKIRKTYENDEKRRKDGKMGRRAGLHFIRYEGRQKVFRVGDVARLARGIMQDARLVSSKNRLIVPGPPAVVSGRPLTSSI